MTVGLRRKRFINWCVGYGFMPIWSYVGMRIPWNTVYAGFVGFPVGLTTFCYVWFLLYLAFLVFFLDEPDEEAVEHYYLKVRVGQYLLVKHGLMNRREYPKFIHWDRAAERRRKRERKAREKKIEKARQAKEREKEEIKCKKDKEKELIAKAIEDKEREEAEIKEMEKRLEEEENARIRKEEDHLRKQREKEERRKEKEAEKARKAAQRRERIRLARLARQYPGVDPDGDEGAAMV